MRKSRTKSDGSSVVHTVKLGGKGRNILTLGDRTRAWVQRMSKWVCAADENIPYLIGREAPVVPKKPGAQQVLAIPEVRSKTLSRSKEPPKVAMVQGKTAK